MASNCYDIIVVGIIISENDLMPVESSNLAFTERVDSSSENLKPLSKPLDLL